VTARVILAALLVIPAGFAEQLNEAQQARAKALHRILLAPCCWNEPIATHGSQVSLDMRAEVNRLVAQGKSDREIIDLYKDRYGMRILIEPEGGRSIWIHVVPPVAVLLGLAWVVWVIRRLLKPRPAPDPANP